MTGKILIVPFLIFILGCGQSAYRGFYSALLDSAPPVSTPYKIQEKSTMFVSAYYNFSGGFYQWDSNRFYRLNLISAGGRDFYKWALGGFVYFGNYMYYKPIVIYFPDFKNHVGESEYFVSYPYFGVGFDFDANISIPLGKIMDIGVGTFGGFFGEFGDYTDFRKSRENLNYPPEIGLLVGVYPCFQFNFSENNKLAFRVGQGLPGFIFANLSFYNAKYGGLWVGSHLQENGKFKITSVGVSVRVK
jgi:hypothetical protein